MTDKEYYFLKIKPFISELETLYSYGISSKEIANKLSSLFAILGGENES